MMLSPEDRDKIYEEEKARKEAQDQIAREEEQAKKAEARRKGKWFGLATFVIFGGLLVITSLTGSNDGKGQRTAPLHATLQYNGTEFIVSNQDGFDWRNTELIVNLGMRSVSTAKVGTLSAGQTYTIAANQFVDSDGARFNPAAHKPKTLSIVCTTPSGQAAWSGVWKIVK